MFYFGPHGFHFPFPWSELSFITVRQKIFYTIPQCSYIYEMINGSHCTSLCMPHILWSDISKAYVPERLFRGFGIILVLDQILLA